MDDERLNKQVRFYDSHSEFVGAMIPLPIAIRDVIRKLNRKTTMLLDGLNKINAALKDDGGQIGELTISKDNTIILHIPKNPFASKEVFEEWFNLRYEVRSFLLLRFKII